MARHTIYGSLLGTVFAAILHTPTQAADRFIVMAFDDIGSTVREDAFNSCSEARLGKVKPEEITSAQRFALNDVQMFGGVSVALPRYLTLVELPAPDAAGATEAAARILSEPCGEDPRQSIRYTYCASGETMKRVHPDPKIPEGGARQAYAHIVFTVPNEAVRGQFEDWYFSCHMPEILERTGLVSGQRGIDGSGSGPVPPTRTMGLYRIALPDGMTIADTRPGPRAPGARNCNTGQMMNGDLSRGYSYRAIGPVFGTNR